MFYGSLPKKSDVPIVDASVAAFKEFLHHFYFPQIKLTSKHIVEGMNLCKKYELTVDSAACEDSLMNTLSFDDICWSYGVASHLDLEKLTKLCIDIIQDCFDEILGCQSFLECDKKLFTQILSIYSPFPNSSNPNLSGTPNWCAVNKVFACMEWAKAECSRNNLENNSQNIRTQLGDLYHQIPFDRLKMDELHQFVVTYREFFSIDEFESLILK